MTAAFLQVGAIAQVRLRRRCRRRCVTIVAGAPVEKIGIGTYRLSNDVQKHRRTLKTALNKGIRFIDTSTTWNNGRSEKLVGEILDELVDEKALTRNEVTIVTKTGFLEGANLDVLQQQDRVPECVPYSETGFYSLQPEFIRSEVSASLQRLNVDYIDYYLLQNPEIYLESSVLLDDISEPDDPRIPGKQEKFKNRLYKAFIELENQCQSGRIRAYGVSSSLFTSNWGENPIGIPCELVLETAQKAAEDVGLDSTNFKMVQMPVNLLERSALASDGAIPWAKANGLKVVTTRPLNAYSNALGRSMRLTEAEPVSNYSKERDVLLSTLRNNGMEEVASVVQKCDEIKGEFRSIIDYEQTMTNSILPIITNMLSKRAEINAVLITEIDKFFESLQQTVRSACSKDVAREVDVLQSSNLLGDSLKRENESLQQFALRWLLEKPDLIDVVLVGLTKEDYVDDVLQLALVGE
mmetsp:Transcript_7250/g.22097  ORF Transcript_7250/g.22097 Transcript_7250/m.22097 type:complete len:467 (-) Transcript_7250:1100-2500(-)